MGSWLKPCSLFRLGRRAKLSFLETRKVDKNLKWKNLKSDLETACQIKTWYDNEKLVFALFSDLDAHTEKLQESSLTWTIAKLSTKIWWIQNLRLLSIHNYSRKMHTKFEGNRTVEVGFWRKRMMTILETQLRYISKVLKFRTKWNIDAL